MNASRPLLFAGSLALNVVLITFLGHGLAARRASVVAPPPSAAPATISLAAPAYDANTWSQLHTDDLAALVGRLRAAGFPPVIVRAILQSQMEEEYFARRRAANPDAEQVPYWKNPTFDPQTEIALRQLGREQMKRLRELLGPDAESIDPLMRVRQNRQLSHLSSEKAEQVRQLMRDFNELRNDVIYQSPTTASIGANEREKLLALEKRQTEEIRRLLTPQEFEEFELRGSPISNYLRSRLTGLEVTEDEFRMMFRLLQPMVSAFDPASITLDPELARRRSEALRQANEQVKMALGPVRGAEFERGSHFEYSRTSQLVARLQLPPERTAQIWAAQQELTDRYHTLSVDRSLSSEQRTQRVKALVQEATDRLTPLLGGPRGFEAYRENTGTWLQGLSRPR